MKSVLIAMVVSAYFFSDADPQEMLNTQYKAYITAQAFNPIGVKKYHDRIVGPAKKLPKSAQLFLDTNIDWETYAESVFRPNWDKLTKLQQKKFKRLLQRDIMERYGYLFSPNMKFSAKFNGPTEYKLLHGIKFAKVSTTLSATRSDAEANVDFIFRKGQKRWALCDVYLDGVSKSKSYRRSVRKIYKKKGYKGVIDTFRNNLDRKSVVLRHTKNKGQ